MQPDFAPYLTYQALDYPKSDHFGCNFASNWKYIVTQKPPILKEFWKNFEIASLIFQNSLHDSVTYGSFWVFDAGPYLTPVPLTPAVITPVSNCVEYKKIHISAFNGNIRQKTI